MTNHDRIDIGDLELKGERILINESRAKILAIVDGAETWIMATPRQIAKGEPECKPFAASLSIYSLVSNHEIKPERIILNPNGSKEWPYPLADENTPKDRGCWMWVDDGWAPCYWQGPEQITYGQSWEEDGSTRVVGFTIRENNPYDRDVPPPISEDLSLPIKVTTGGEKV